MDAAAEPDTVATQPMPPDAAAVTAVAVPAQRGDHVFDREPEPGPQGTGRPWSGVRYGHVVGDNQLVADGEEWVL
jgi:hypothetical protein